MNIPYVKVTIYCLTFLTYAYTGYGSNIITSLRDAIIAAETVFGDVFKNLIHIAKKFKTVHEVFDAAVDENCVFKCPGDVTPVRNKFYTPSADGCGSLGMKINTEYLPATEMANCCDSHDICYDTCNKDKELCDLDFKRCLYNYCDSYEKTVVGDIVVKGCKAAAKMLFTGTLTLGCKSYLDAQSRSCYCAGGGGGGSAENSNGQQQSYNNKKKYKEKDKTDKQKQQKQPPNYGWKSPEEI